MIVRNEVCPGILLRWIVLHDLETGIISMIGADGRHRDIRQYGRVGGVEDHANAIQVRMPPYQADDIVFIGGWILRFS